MKSIDLDGFNLSNDITELTSPSRGCLEVVIQRENNKVTRFFDSNDQKAFADLYNQASANPKVIMFSVV
ncbi:TPA: hypothetical protein I7730_15925 [Vibrio vulnificus]|uniref:Uncharacterized protein n=1 Tax=Vibrio vulnificus TaxID=672 RepID=A0A8H9TGA0_VIBVL|nr:hypothetical protein [Vibrio vulnificus]HAS8541271.1 hypothetical protein [Vibrio vulnificus]